MSLIATDRHGNHCAVSTAPGRTYVYRADGMDAWAEAPRLVVEV
jgi:beta-aspartyl-peptidase (threonine type)